MGDGGPLILYQKYITKEMTWEMESTDLRAKQYCKIDNLVDEIIDLCVKSYYHIHDLRDRDNIGAKVYYHINDVGDGDHLSVFKVILQN